MHGGMKEGWFTELCPEGGSAFALQIEQRLHQERTAYQNIEIYATRRFGHLMVIDGFIMLSQRDNFLYHEMMSHPALFTHADPKRVVIIGGGDCGTLHEVLKHPGVEHVLQVEIDERVTRLAERYFPELCASNHDPRAEFYFGDGLAWVKQAPPGSVDVIIVDGTDPIGPAEGLFQAPFYHDCRALLGDAGVLAQQSESPLFHLELIKSMHRAMGESGFSHTKVLHFPQCVYPSGWWTATLAGNAPAAALFRDEAAARRTFSTRYYSADMHRAALAQPPFVEQALAE